MDLNTHCNITFCISTYNNLNYLKLAIKSVRQNSFYTDAPFVVHAENCTDGTNDWLRENHKQFNIQYVLDINETSGGIGGGMNTCAAKVTTKYICFLHSDMIVTPNWDKHLVEYAEQFPRTWVDAFRVEPDIFNSPPARKATIVVPLDAFGEYHYNFNDEQFQLFAEEFSKLNLGVTMPVVQGVSGLIEKTVWDEIGGNDPRFAPASWEDLDLFYRMQQLNVNYVSITSSVVYHFAARGSHFLTDDLTTRSDRQIASEQANMDKWIQKWKAFPVFNEYGMIIGLQ